MAKKLPKTKVCQIHKVFDLSKHERFTGNIQDKDMTPDREIQGLNLKSLTSHFIVDTPFCCDVRILSEHLFTIYSDCFIPQCTAKSSVPPMVTKTSNTSHHALHLH